MLSSTAIGKRIIIGHYCQAYFRLIFENSWPGPFGVNFKSEAIYARKRSGLRVFKYSQSVGECEVKNAKDAEGKKRKSAREGEDK